MRSETYIIKIKSKVKKRENAESDYLSQISDFVFYPAQKAADYDNPNWLINFLRFIKRCLCCQLGLTIGLRK